MEEDRSSGTSAGPPSTSSRSAQKHEAPSAPESLATGGSASNLQASKRRRGLGVVTPNACTECRKKRAKCDGRTPCGRCSSQKDVECVYEVPVRQSKENLRTEIDTLRRQQQQNESVFTALVRPDLWEDVMTRLRNGHSVEGISEWLGGHGRSGGSSNHASNNELPNFAPPDEPRSGVPLPPISTYGGTHAGAGGYAPFGMPSGNAQGPAGKQDVDSNSPWGFSSQSQPISQRSNSHPDAMQWTSEGREGPPRTRVGMWLQDQSSPTDSGNGNRYRGVDQVLAPLESPEVKVPASSWTSVTNDSALVQHLLALYFCWEYPTFASLSKEHFMKDYLHGRNRYCSSILVNALLALGCRFSAQPNTREDPNDPRSSGDHFFKEALRLINREKNHHTLTTIQALGIMSIREASCGRDSESWYYAGQSVRLAIELGLHRIQNDGDQDELAVQAATFWGAFALDHAWSLATGCLPQCSCFPHLPPKPAIIDDIEASLWVPYTDDGAPMHRSCEQPSNVRSVYKYFCELSELVHQSSYVLHSPGKPVTSRDLLHIYTQYLDWYDRIPEVLRLGHNFTPAVLFAHMYYHFAILLLFRPLLKLRIIGSSILPRDICAQAADAIQGLLHSYSQLYTLRRTPSFVPYFVLTSSIMHLAIGVGIPNGQTSPAATSNSTVKLEDMQGNSSNAAPSSDNGAEPEPPTPSSTATAKLDPRVTETLNQGIAHLVEMAPCHHFAEQALNILRYLAKKWDIDVEIPQNSTATEEEVDKMLRPSTTSLNFFAPSLQEEDYMCSLTGSNKPSNNGKRGKKPSSKKAQQADPSSGGGSGGGGEKMEGVVGNGGEEGQGQGGREQGNHDKGEQHQQETQTYSWGHGGSSGGPMAHTVKSMENPLFWPFPMQGRPMLPEGDQLEEAGFCRL
ncbi:fungal-specific transcription factor domain-containing protein [Xylariaceae sp. FL0804]|nr:fungal-specific transcription factor domain-containing protein [Xylariaceae sp. FL0804]